MTPLARGFAVQAEPFRPDCGYRATSHLADGMRAELAGPYVQQDCENAARSLFGLPATVAAHRHEDPARGHLRFAFTREGRLIAALFVKPGPVALARNWLAAQIGAEPGPVVLSGQPCAETPETGAEQYINFASQPSEIKQPFRQLVVELLQARFDLDRLGPAAIEKVGVKALLRGDLRHQLIMQRLQRRKGRAFRYPFVADKDMHRHPLGFPLETDLPGRKSGHATEAGMRILGNHHIIAKVTAARLHPCRDIHRVADRRIAVALARADVADAGRTGAETDPD